MSETTELLYIKCLSILLSIFDNKNMSTKKIYFLSFILMVSSNVQNSFIIDYFIYNKVSAVVGFSCNIKEGNYSMGTFFKQ